ncbi:MAG: type II/IV secretion system protein [Parcubacteria group bacterium]|nr:type II/IV secretion system protein [Parcubacteria group bacterium]
MNLLSVLAKKNLVSNTDIVSVEAEAKQSGELIESILIKRGVSASEILAAKAEYFNLPPREMGDAKVSYDILKYVPAESALHYSFVPLGLTDGVLEVGIVDPDNIEALDALNFISSKVNLPFKIFLISQTDFEKVHQMYKGLTGEVSSALTDLESELSSDQKAVQKEIDNAASESAGDNDVIKEDAPVTKIVAIILRHAVVGGASDVHIEHVGEKVKVRFRVDGILSTNLLLPVSVHRSAVARIKILSAMRLDERRKPQDGRFSANIDNRKVDFRVSTFPAYYGEKVVMRILDRDKGFFKLDELGFSPRSLVAVKEAIAKPFGLILISGPTGSGKSTTLYSMLSEVDRETKNVLSLEDPVEYNMDGVSQSQVRPEIGYTFASGLRTTLRQDPDVIMVGEIRDKETAQLAVQAALTGHLVLSTIHTNNAIGVIPRLIDMGVDPFLIAPTLQLAIAQRLVKKLCDGTGKEIPVNASVKAIIDKEFSDLPETFKKEIPNQAHLYGLEPTAECPSGSKGRVPVFEVLSMNSEIEKTILTKPVDTEILKVARANGMFTMKEDAIIKSFNRIVPFEEINTLGGTLLISEEAEDEEAESAKGSVVSA